MSRANTIQTNFTAGEISPTLRGRVDISRYQNGAATLKNFIVKPQGGIFARPGTVHIREVKSSAKRGRLYEFEYSETVNYLLEFGDLCVRIFKDNVYVGTEVVTPYLEADLPFLKFTQSADVLYICHPSYQTRKLIRTSDVIWAMSLYEQTDGPYLAVNDSDTQMRVSGYSDTATITTSADSFVIGDVGKFVEYTKAGIPLLALITAYVGAREVTVIPKDNVIAPVDPVAILTRGALKITSSHAIFSNNNVGNYIRLTSGDWDLITAYVSETQVTVGAGTKAELDLGTKAAGNLDTVVEATADGSQGNDITVQATGDGAPASGVVINVTGNVVVIHYESTVSTVADVEAAIAALSGTSDIIAVKTAGTGATILNAGTDNFAASNLAGGTTSVTKVATAGTVSLINRVITGTVLPTADVFVPTDVGRHLRLNFSGQQVWGIITGYTGARQVAVSFDRSIPLKERDVTQLIDDGLTVSWRLGAWGATTGYPSVVTFHEERLVFAASPLEPQTFWMSVSGDYENMAPTDTESKVLDDNAITFTIASNKVNGIRWAISGPTLVFGTMGGEWQVSASSIKEAITPTNISVVQHTAHGSGHIRPLRVGPAILFMQKSGTKLRELVYDYQTDSLVAKDVTIISEHILRRGVKAVEVAYQQEQNSVIWSALSDGGLVGLTYVRDQEVYAWHYHEIGGVFGSGKAVVESVACLPASSGTYDSLYLIVKRTINGATKRYIEYMDLEYDPPTETSRSSLYYVDAGVKYAGAATSSVPVAHLVGQTVSVLADGSARPNVVAVAGLATFAGGAATTAAVGLPYESLLVTLPPEAGGEAGTAQGKTKRVHRAKIRVYKSMGFKYGPSEAKLSQYNFRATNDAMDNAPRIRSDDVPLTMDNGYDLAGSITIKRDQPYPLNILSVMPEFVTNE
jgi:hypothetical protein